MKKLLFGAFALGLTSLCFSQETQGGIEAVSLEGVTISPVLNSSYRNLAYHGVISDNVKNLEHEAARFDVTTTPDFDGRMEAFDVIFRQTNGRIVAVYGKDGKIISTIEKFKNIALPPAVRNSAYMAYPEFVCSRNYYLVNFRGENDINKVYHLQMKKDNKKINLRMDMDGNILD